MVSGVCLGLIFGNKCLGFMELLVWENSGDRGNKGDQFFGLQFWDSWDLSGK